MKILRLDLLAYGPFTDVRLDLGAGKEGLHIVYGANEAGKSSALRALRHLLYGIPERTPDAFIHPFPKLRIGGALRSTADGVLEVVRRKGRGNTLKAADDKTAVEETELQRFLNGVDAGLFATMFGIGYEDLIAGGREIVQGGGDLGRLIFAAGSGAAGLGAVLGELQAEADALFRPAGQKQRINEAVGRLKQLRSDLKEALLPAPEWERHDQALKEAQTRKASVGEALAAAQRKVGRLKRIAEAHPVIPARLETLKALEPVADAVLLPEGFAERRSSAHTRLQVAESDRNQALAELAGLRAALAELEDPAEILGHAEAIEEIHQGLGSLRKAAKDRISLATRRNTLRSEARQTLRNLRDDLALEDADRLRIRKADAVRIRELGVEYERIATRMESVREKIPELTLQLDDVANRLAALPVRRPIDALKSALAVSEEALPTAKQLRSLRAEKQTLVQACERGQTKLGLSTVPLGSLGSVQAPVGETVQLFEDRFDALERRRSLAEEEIRKAEAEFLETERRLREARLEREVPSEEDLKAARELRDRGWRLVARQLSGDEVPEDERRAFLQTFPGKDRLVDAFEASIQQADAVSDRLRREADRVASYARLKADRLTLQERIERSRKELSAVLSEKAAAEDEWGGLWKPVSVAARSPREMRQWLQDFSVLAEKASETLKRMSLCETMVEEVDNAFAALGRGLQSVAEPPAEAGESLPALVKRVRDVVDNEENLARRHDEFSRERNRLENELASAKARLQAIEAELQRWRKDWELALRPLGLEAGTPPAAAAAVMEELKGLFDRLREAEVLQQRVDGIDRDAEAFAAEVKKTAEAVAADLSVRPAEEAAIELQRRLTAARGAQSRRQGLQKQIEQTHAKQRKAESSLAEIASLLKVMCADAGCTHSDELPEAERRSALRARLEDQLRQHNERLQQLSGGLSIDEFAAEAMSVDPDGIAGDIERLDEEITRLTSERSVLDQTIGRETSELGRMDGGSRAAGIAEDIQLILGGLETDVVNYARLKIAARVLGLAVERFREKSQGPILRKASGFFSRITCGSFDGIRADHDPDGNPVLVGVRSGGKETVPVGGMSDGTADQLYLALRLAGLDHYLDGNEPMPFIVDDILVKFDNDRATAALQTLAELSQKTQVIFFTHHRHLVDLAVKSVAGAMLFEHSLDASRPAVL